ncbi:hypothetical protein QYM36_008634 [Artemia franciscana]|uniref:Uncharacterized protein n=1 Tax=Artemia franciscana TaxID=6661 RepID=A0AA88L2I1_ARTSF|nr:hypothetical protein QYM36_008634 [Artemia franciscana]
MEMGDYIISIMENNINTGVRKNNPYRVNLSGELSDDDRLKITKYLVDNRGIETNYSVDFVDGTALHCNAKIPESFRNQAELFKNPDGFNLNRYFEKSLRLHLKHTHSIKFITRKNGNVNLSDRNGNTPLHWAADLQQVEIVKLLLQHGAIYNVINLNGSTPLEDLTSRHTDLLNEKGKKIV